jgi:queuosine precursor transporter
MDFMNSNEVLWAVMLLVNFGAIILAYRVFGRTGLYVWIAVAGIVANLQVSKTIEVFGLTATLGNIVYAGSFLATDILNEKRGPRAARFGVWIGFFSVVVMTVLMTVALWFQPAPSDTMQEHLAVVFGVLPRITVASLLAYLISQQHDVWAFQFWKVRFPGPLWLRNNLSTLVSQLIDSVVFTLVAFLGVFPFGTVAEIVLTTYLIKLVVAVLDTPFFYLAVRLSPPAGEPEE